MTRREMLDVTRRELAHIPDWPQHQRALRMTFWNLRLNSLGKRAEYPDDPLAVVETAIRMSEAAYPLETFEYDRAFFETESQGRKESPMTAPRARSRPSDPPHGPGSALSLQHLVAWATGASIMLCTDVEKAVDCKLSPGPTYNALVGNDGTIPGCELGQVRASSSSVQVNNDAMEMGGEAVEVSDQEKRGGR